MFGEIFRLLAIGSYSESLIKKDNNNRLYITKKEGRRGAKNIDDSVDAAIQGPEEYTKK